MTSREKIIIGLMILAVGYGVYTVVFSAPGKAAFPGGGHKELKALNSFVSKIAAKTKTGLSKEQAYVLQKIRAEWKQDPFVQIQPKPTREEEAEKRPLVLKRKIAYTGFLEMNDKRLAILNGLEYEIGDRLEPDGLVVREINPTYVVVAAPDRKNMTMTLPMEEVE